MAFAPDSYFLEVEFTAGVWTDITTYLDAGAGVTTRYGRSTQYGADAGGDLDATVENTDGRFTPLRQTLKDLVTAHPYYPNLTPAEAHPLGLREGRCSLCALHRLPARLAAGRHQRRHLRSGH
jgi:hypothetical protein